jgi:hypothetical protein
MEIAQAYQWVNSTMIADAALTAAATGGVWQGYADINTTGPYALFTQQAGSDVLTINAVRLFTHLLLQIKAVGPASNYPTLVTIANRIDALFGRVGPITLSPGVVLAAHREQTLAYEELINGAQWSHLGGLYQIDLQGA